MKKKHVVKIVVAVVGGVALIITAIIGIFSASSTDKEIVINNNIGIEIENSKQGISISTNEGSDSTQVILDSSSFVSASDEIYSTDSMITASLDTDKRSTRVSLNANGGSVDQSFITVTFGKQYVGLPIPQWDNYSFDGWYTSDVGGSKVIEGMKVVAPIPSTLYAHWGTQVSLNANGGGVSQNSIPVILGEKYVGLPIPKRDNYSFDGWYTSEVGGSKIIEGMKVVAPVPNALYAHWEVQVSLDANGGSVGQGFVPVTLGEKYVGLPIPQRENYSFGGWYTSEVGGNKIIEGMQVVAPVPKTLYAHWNLNSPVSNSNVPVRDFLQDNLSAVLNGSQLTIIIDKAKADELNKKDAYPFKWGIHLTSRLGNEDIVGEYVIELELCIDSDGSISETGAAAFRVTSPNSIEHVQSNLTNVDARLDNGNYILSCDISNNYIRLEDICINTTYNY